MSSSVTLLLSSCRNITSQTQNEPRPLPNYIGGMPSNLFMAHGTNFTYFVSCCWLLSLRLLDCRLVNSAAPTIIVTTMQKFQKLKNLKPEILLEKEIALIADEAHRSHGKSTTRNLHGMSFFICRATHDKPFYLELLTGDSRQSSKITYFSFTATPNAKALEMFGVKNSAGEFEPFYTYRQLEVFPNQTLRAQTPSIEQAINEGHIMDVLANYRSVGTLAKLKQKNDNGNVTYDKGHQATYHLINTATDDRYETDRNFTSLR